MTGNLSILAKRLLMKLCVDPLSIKTITSCDPIFADTRMVFDVVQPVKAWKVISSSRSGSHTTTISPLWLSSSICWFVMSSHIMLPIWPSKSNSCNFWHMWFVVKRSLQLKHRPCALFLYISSQDIRLMGPAGVAGATRVVCGRANRAHSDGGRMNLLCRASWSSLIRAKLMASLSDRGLNIWIPSAIYVFKPPMNVPTNTFWVHP